MVACQQKIYWNRFPGFVRYLFLDIVRSIFPIHVLDRFIHTCDADYDFLY